MTFIYEYVLDANHPNWGAHLKAYLNNGKQVKVVNISAAHFSQALALAQEHDFTCVVEAAGTLGVIPRDPSKWTSIQDVIISGTYAP